MERAEFLALLHKMIEAEAELMYEADPVGFARINEPYRAAGDNLVDAALAIFD